MPQWPKEPAAFHRNLTASKAAALRDLRTRRDIIIKDADKGSDVVVMHTERYIAEGLRHLSDPTTYSPLDTNPMPVLVIQLQSLLNKLRDLNVITDDMCICLDHG